MAKEEVAAGRHSRIEGKRKVGDAWHSFHGSLGFAHLQNVRGRNGLLCMIEGIRLVLVSDGSLLPAHLLVAVWATALDLANCLANVKHPATAAMACTYVYIYVYELGR